MNDHDRRAFFTIAGAGVLLAACRREERTLPEAFAAPASAASNPADPSKEDAEDVTATEDLMREHGVIRRVLVVYREASMRLRSKPASVPPDALQRAAKLIRTFGEDYHEKQLEEAHIFPPLTRAPAPLAGTVETLIAQHRRGREITDYILAVTQKTIDAHTAEPLAHTLEAFARMYEEHTAIEDTVIFPGWKRAISPKELDEMSDLFEDIEHKTFGKDGFENAVIQVAGIEKALGIELAGLTPPPPPPRT